MFVWTCIQNLWILHFQDWMPTCLWITCELSAAPPQVSRQKRKETEIKSQTDLQPFSAVNVTGWPFVCPHGLQERVLPRTLLWTETMAEAEHKRRRHTKNFLPLPSFTSRFILMLETVPTHLHNKGKPEIFLMTKTNIRSRTSFWMRVKAKGDPLIKIPFWCIGSTWPSIGVVSSSTTFT